MTTTTTMQQPATGGAADAGVPVGEAPRQGQGHREVRARLERAGQTRGHIGYTVTWSVERVLVPAAELRALLDANGFAHVKLAPIRTARAVATALGEMARDGWVEETADDDRRTTWHLLTQEIERDTSGGDDDVVRLRSACRVTLLKHPAPGQDPLVVTPAEYGPEVRALIDRYRTCYLSRDLTRGVIAGVLDTDAHMVGFRTNGGCYFVPAAGEDVLRRLRALLEELVARRHAGADTFLVMIRVPDDEPAERADVARGAHRTFMAELHTLEARLGEFRRDARSAGPEIVARHLAAVDKVMQEATLYRDLLAMDVEDVERAQARLRGEYEETYRAALSRRAEREAERAAGRAARPAAGAPAPEPEPDGGLVTLQED